MTKWTYRIEEEKGEPEVLRFFSEIYYWLDALWRRRLLVLLPILISIPISILTVHFIPKVYSTKSVILFGESQIQETPLGQDTSGIEAIARFRLGEQIGAIKAWLTSDHVLSGLVDLIENRNEPLSENYRSAQIAILKHSISFSPVGNNALEIELTGSEKKGLARKLEIIITRFLEGLDRTDDNIFLPKEFFL